MLKKSEHDSKLSGMGTTLTCCNNLRKQKNCICPYWRQLHVFVMEDAIIQITEDHTYVNDLFKAGNITYEQVKNHPQRNILTKDGGFGNAEADVFSIDGF